MSKTAVLILCLISLMFGFSVMADNNQGGQKVVDIAPPDPIGELGSGFDKIASGNIEKPASLTIEGK